jgi:hypothetical protein
MKRQSGSGVGKLGRRRSPLTPALVPSHLTRAVEQRRLDIALVGLAIVAVGLMLLAIGR